MVSNLVEICNRSEIDFTGITNEYQSSEEMQESNDPFLTVNADGDGV